MKNLHFNLSRFYFFYYFFVGAFVPYWGLYLQSEHFSAADIGILMSLFQISRIFAPNLWGWLADHTKQRVKWIRLTALLGLLGFTAVFWAHGFFWFFFVMAALSLFTSSTLPLSESLTLAHLATTNGHYSKIRMWGSLGFIGASVMLGFTIDTFGIQSLLWFLLGVQIILFALTFKLPEATVAPHEDDHFSFLTIIKNPTVIALLLGCALMVTAHGVLYNFYSIYLAQHGYSITWFEPGSNGCERMTRPVRSKGNAASGSETINRTTLPAARGLRVLMKMPPRLMLTAQSVMKPSTVR